MISQAPATLAEGPFEINRPQGSSSEIRSSAEGVIETANYRGTLKNCTESASRSTMATENSSAR